MYVRRLAALAIGAAIGASLRWAVMELLGPAASDTAVLAVNVLGCALLGTVSMLPPTELTSVPKTFLGAGLSGALTTWSTLALQIGVYLRAGQWSSAVTWLALNIAAGLTAAALGREIGRSRWHDSATVTAGGPPVTGDGGSKP